jgi:hypothetical protein
MKLALDYKLRIDEDLVDSQTLATKLDAYKERLAKTPLWEGALILKLDGTEHCEEFVDPILRLGDQWIRKLPWVLTGDTETVAYRNSEHVFAFVPEGDSVELSFFLGSENEVEEYVIEPSNVRLAEFANESIKLGERLLDLVKKVNPALLDSVDDIRDLKNSLDEGRKAWRDHQLHNRR